MLCSLLHDLTPTPGVLLVCLVYHIRWLHRLLCSLQHLCLRRQLWHNFVSSINSWTSLKQVWNMINKISGKRAPTEIKSLQVGDRNYSSQWHCRYTAQSFLELPSTVNHTTQFQIFKAHAEHQPLEFNSNSVQTTTPVLNGQTIRCSFWL